MGKKNQKRPKIYLRNRAQSTEQQQQTMKDLKGKKDVTGSNFGADRKESGAAVFSF